MPEKTIREMNEFERRHYSLAARVFHATVFGAVVLGAAAFLIGIVLFTYALVGQYIGESFGLARSAAAVIDKAVNVEDYSEAVIERYKSLSAEERANPDSADYLKKFEDIPKTEDVETVRLILKEFKDASDVYDIYLGMYDIDDDALIYIVDPTEEDNAPAGYWDAVEHKGAVKFLNWNGEGKLYEIDKTEKYGWMCTSGVPIRGTDGQIYGFVLADVTLENVAHGMRMFTLLFTIGMIIVVSVYAILITRHMKKSLVAPINEIADAAQKYIDDRRSGSQEQKNHFSDLKIRTGDEIENLSFVLADMEKDAVQYFEELTAVTAEKERISTELNLATRIQQNVLPNIFPAFPEREEFEVYAIMDPAKEVGGDFYDFFMVDQDHLALVIADVSGKGVPAALFMMTARTMLKDAALSGEGPAQILEKVNGQLSENNRDLMFVTVWIGILEISTGRLVYADAGHEKLLVCRDGAWELLPKKTGVALAAFEPELLQENTFQDCEIMMKPGDMICQYTDGVTEAMTASREQFGTDRLLSTVSGSDVETPTALLPYIREKIDEFVGAADQFDDITMLALQYRGKA